MARPAASLTGRLRKLEAAQQRAARLKRGARLTAAPMAELLGVRWPTLREWCDEIGKLESSGAVVRGGNGIEWEFEPRKTCRILIDELSGRIQSQAKKSRELTKAIGVDMSPAESAPSFAETKQLIELTMTVQQAAERQGRYVLADHVSSFIEGYNQTVVDALFGVRTKVDPNGNLPPHVRKAMDDHIRSIAASVHESAAAYIGAMRAGLQQAGVG